MEYPSGKNASNLEASFCASCVPFLLCEARDKISVQTFFMRQKGESCGFNLDSAIMVMNSMVTPNADGEIAPASGSLLPLSSPQELSHASAEPSLAVVVVADASAAALCSATRKSCANLVVPYDFRHGGSKKNDC